MALGVIFQEPEEVFEMTHTVCIVYPIVGCLLKADDIIGEGRVWFPESDPKVFVDDYYTSTKDEIEGVPEIES